jgi:hypothetical protein
MDGIGPGRLGRGDDLVGAQVAFAGRARADLDDFIGKRDERCRAIRRRGDGNAFYAQPACRAHNASCDFAAIGDQDLLQHCRVSLWHCNAADGNRSDCWVRPEQPTARHLIAIYLTDAAYASRGSPRDGR